MLLNYIINNDRIRQELETCPETKIGDSRSVEWNGKRMRQDRLLHKYCIMYSKIKRFRDLICIQVRESLTGMGSLFPNPWQKKKTNTHAYMKLLQLSLLETTFYFSYRRVLLQFPVSFNSFPYLIFISKVAYLFLPSWRPPTDNLATFTRP